MVTLDDDGVVGLGEDGTVQRDFDHGGRLDGGRKETCERRVLSDPCYLYGRAHMTIVTSLEDPRGVRDESATMVGLVRGPQPVRIS